jgi:hypothetical protein
VLNHGPGTGRKFIQVPSDTDGIYSRFGLCRWFRHGGRNHYWFSDRLSAWTDKEIVRQPPHSSPPPKHCTWGERVGWRRNGPGVFPDRNPVCG